MLLIGPFQDPEEGILLELANRITEGTLLLCSDGSFHPHRGIGSHAWIFSTPEGEILLKGAEPIDCNPRTLSSYRTELGGLAAVLYVLQIIVQVFEVETGVVTLYCDNKSALENTFDEMPKRGIYPLLATDYDLLILLREILSTLPIQVIIRHIKGHYKGDERRVEHDLNALADTMAEQFRLDPPKGYEPTSYPQFHKAHIVAAYIEGSMITSKLKSQVYSRMYQKELEQTLCKRYRWTADIFTRIDSDIFGKVFKAYSRFQQIGVAKMVHDLWNTGQQKVLFKQDKQGLCPCCKNELETSSHIFHCKSSVATSNREQQMQAFNEFHDKQEIAISIKRCMVAGMQGWIQSEEEKPTLHALTRGKLMPTEQMATQAFSDQTAIGWDGFFQGFLSTSRKKAILFSSPVRNEDTTELQIRGLIKKLHALSLSIWVLSSGTPEDYRSAYRQCQLARADTLLVRMDELLRLPSTDPANESSYLDGSNQESSEGGNFQPSSTAESSSMMEPPGDSSPLWSPETQRLLRFPLHRMVDTSQQSVRFDTPYQRVWQNSDLPSDGEQAEENSPPATPAKGAVRVLPRRIYIEEFTPPAKEESFRIGEQQASSYFPLAQPSDASSFGSDEGEKEEFLPNTTQEWVAAVGGSSPPFEDTDTSSARSVWQEDSTSSGCKLLEILSPPSSDSSSERSGMRGLSSMPVWDHNSTSSDSESVPSLAPGHEVNVDTESSSLGGSTVSDSDTIVLEQLVMEEGTGLPQLVQGMAQGMAIAPVSYVTMEEYLARLAEESRAYHESGDQQLRARYAGEFYDETDVSLQSLERGGYEEPERSEASSDLSATEESIYVALESGSEANPGADSGSGATLDMGEWGDGIEFEGATVASTARYMSDVVVWQIEQGPVRLRNSGADIPIRELDDPPDAVGDGAASLGDRENEQDTSI